MTQEKRLDTLEGDLTPKELMIRWMREAHECGDYTSYGSWLLTQPEDAYPLIKLPKTIYEGTKARMRGKKDEQLRALLRSSYRDLFFLFHLHSQLNERVTFRLPELRWQVLFLSEQQRRFMERGAAQEERTELLRLIPGKKPRLPRRDKAHDQETLKIWEELATVLDEDLRDLLGAAERLSARYYSGEDLLYPQGRSSLLHILEVLFCDRRLYDLCFGTRAERTRIAETLDDPFVLGPLTAYGRDLAVELVILAKAEALTMLGEQRAGVRLVEEWLRSSGFSER